MISNLRASSKGFTLVEVLVAMFILTGGIIVISMSWSGNFMRIRKANMYNNVATLLERKMVEIEAEYKSKQLSEIPEEAGEDFGEDYKNYRWEMKSKELKFPDLSPLMTSQEGGADETLISMIKQMTEFLGKAIKEVKVTIFVKGASGKEVEFSAVQYFVDFTQGFAGLPAGAGATAEGQTPPQGGGN